VSDDELSFPKPPGADTYLDGVVIDGAGGSIMQGGRLQFRPTGSLTVSEKGALRLGEGSVIRPLAGGFEIEFGLPAAPAASVLDELRRQWECNHVEHCSREWPHPEGRLCHWPLPAVLKEP
jgi:hypothetical protein